MAAPNYGEDLTDIIANITSITGWTALGGGASGLAFGPDFAMQGTNAVDKAITASEKGQVFGTTAITPGANTHFFVWAFLATPGLSNTLANRGLAIIIGTSTTAYVAFHVEGNNTYGAAGRVAKCYPIRYVNTASAGVRTLTGAPGANPTQFGATTNITGTVKGSNLGVSAIRYGTGMYITAGDVATPATFAGASLQNDAISNRWGILTSLGGSSYELQGRFVIGQNISGVATLAYFDDANKSILLVDTPHSQTDFTQIIVDHASTVCKWSGISIEAAGTNNPGKLVVNNAASGSRWENCSFVNIGTTSLHQNMPVTSVTWRGSKAVTQNGSTITSCTFSRLTDTVALNVSALGVVTDCTFISSGTGHAVDLGTISSSQTLSWNNDTAGYATNAGTAANRAVKVNVAAGQTLTLSIAAGRTTPSIYNVGTGSVVISSNQSTITIKGAGGISLAGAEIRIYDDNNSPAGSFGTELSGTENNPSSTYAYTDDAANAVIIQIMLEGYQEFKQPYTIPSASTDFTAVLIPETNL